MEKVYNKLGKNKINRVGGSQNITFIFFFSKPLGDTIHPYVFLTLDFAVRLLKKGSVG